MPIDQKLDVVGQEAAKLHADQTNFLQDHNIAVPLQDTKGDTGIMTALQSNAGRSKLVFAKDPAASGAYDSALDVFKSNLKTGNAVSATGGKANTTLAGINEALTSFDKEMEKFGAWDRAQTGELTDTDKARIAAIRDIHTTARDYIDAHLPPNSPWKSIRANESNLYEAATRMSPKLGNTVGQSKFSQFFKDRPVLKRALLWTMYGAVAAGGYGGATELAKTVRIGE